MSGATRLQALLALCAVGGCARPAAPVAVSASPVDAAISPDASHDADVPDAGPAPDAAPPPSPPPPATAPGWVTFDGPPYVDETPMHGGPAWQIYGSKLPARSRTSGKMVIAFSNERGISSVPNLGVRYLSPSGTRVERTVSLLSESEFDHALAGTNEQKRAAFATLGDVVRARVVAVNAELDAADLVPLETCTIDPPDPYADWPPCGAVQTVTCGVVTFRYLGGHQTIETAHGRRTFPSWRKPKVKDSNGGTVEVNECIGAAWLDPEAKVAALVVANLCEVAGDWCSVDSDLRFVGVGK